MKKYPSHHRVIIVSEDDENVETSNEEIASKARSFLFTTFSDQFSLKIRRHGSHSVCARRKLADTETRICFLQIGYRCTRQLQSSLIGYWR